MDCLSPRPCQCSQRLCASCRRHTHWKYGEAGTSAVHHRLIAAAKPGAEGSTCGPLPGSSTEFAPLLLRPSACRVDICPFVAWRTHTSSSPRSRTAAVCSTARRQLASYGSGALRPLPLQMGPKGPSRATPLLPVHSFKAPAKRRRAGTCIRQVGTGQGQGGAWPCGRRGVPRRQPAPSPVRDGPALTRPAAIAHRSLLILVAVFACVGYAAFAVHYVGRKAGGGSTTAQHGRSLAVRSSCEKGRGEVAARTATGSAARHACQAWAVPAFSCWCRPPTPAGDMHVCRRRTAPHCGVRRETVVANSRRTTRTRRTMTTSQGTASSPPPAVAEGGSRRAG